MPRLACKVDLEPRMPLKLKGILMDYGVDQRAFSRAIKQTEGYVDGKPLSLTAAAKLLVKNEWPSLTPKKEIIRQTNEYLLSLGVPKEVRETAFEFDADDTYRGQHPKGCHTGQHGQRHQSNIDIDPIETEMITPHTRQYFKFFRDPFDNDVQCSDDVFMSADQRFIREQMFAVAKHGGLLAVVGESGSGKTTLYNDLMDRINSHADPIIVCAPSVVDVDLSSLKTRLTARRIFESILKQLTGERPGQSFEKLTTQVRNALIATTARTGEKQASVVVVIEEAHSLLPATLKVLKRLLEVREGHRNLLGVILIAQPEMHLLLNENRHPELREFIGRCMVATLLPLDNVLEDYLRLKLKRVGADYNAVFAADAVDAIQQRLTGRDRATNKSVSLVYPLLVNRLVMRALNKAAELGEPRVNADLIKEL